MVKHLLVMLLVLFPLQAFCQTNDEKESKEENKIEDAIQGMLDSHPYKFGIFRIQPIVVMDSGYDSNAISTPGAEVGDYYYSLTPSVNAALRLGHHGYTQISEGITFLYYRDLENLRDMYNTTSGKLVLGTVKSLFQLDASYLNPKSRISSEFDVPAEQRETNSKAQFTYGLRRKTDVIFHVSYNQYLFHPAEGLEGVLLPPDYQDSSLGIGLEQGLGTKFHGSLDFTRGLLHFLHVAEGGVSKSYYWTVDPGLKYTTEKLSASGSVGYEHRDSITATLGTFHNLSYAANLIYLIRKVTLEFTASHKGEVSAILQDGFRIATDYYIHPTLKLTDRFSVDAYYRWGKNDYGDQFFVGEPPVTRDIYSEEGSHLIVALPMSLSLKIGASYYSRDSDSAQLTKNRALLDIGLTYSPGQDRVTSTSTSKPSSPPQASPPH